MSTQRSTVFLKPGMTYTSKSGLTFKLIKQIGNGGQGAVYLVDVKGKQMALKMYHPAQCKPAQAVLLKKIVALQSPSPDFVWPEEFIEIEGVRRFGYLMRLIPAGSVEATAIYGDFKGVFSYRMILDMLIKVFKAFRSLHIAGMAYKDVNFGGFHVHPTTGQLSIVDVDNTTFAGNPQNEENVFFPGFGAPEVVAGKPCTPESDRHSLACLTYCLMLRDNPFEGSAAKNIRVFDGAAEKKLFSKNPVFIWHPTDSSNKPDPEINRSSLALWPRLPQVIRDLFTKTFTDGLAAPERRAAPLEWLEALTDLRNSLYACSKCRHEVFFKPENVTSAGHECPRCKHVGGVGYVLRLPRNKQMFLNGVSVVTVGDFNPGTATSDKVLARVVENPTRPGVFGLRNEGDVWKLIKADGTMTEVPTGKSVVLSPNPVKIQLYLDGPQEWELRVQ